MVSVKHHETMVFKPVRALKTHDALAGPFPCLPLEKWSSHRPGQLAITPEELAELRKIAAERPWTHLKIVMGRTSLWFIWTIYGLYGLYMVYTSVDSNSWLVVIGT